jgi:PEP-CTERM motif
MSISGKLSARRLWGIPFLLGIALANLACADTIAFSGIITQSTSDGTGPAVNNPSLNSIADGDTFLVTLTFTGSITGPGTSSPPGATLTFLDSTASVSETGFGGSKSVSVVSDGASYELSVFGCLTTGNDGCLGGNYLSANFQIPISGLNSASVTAQLVPNLYPPLDLEEDDGTTDIQGSINSYTYSQVPEPSSAALLGLAAAVLAFAKRAAARRETF